MNKKNLIYIVIALIIMIPLALAFTPQSDIDLRKVYQIINGTNISATFGSFTTFLVTTLNATTIYQDGRLVLDTSTNDLRNFTNSPGYVNSSELVPYNQSSGIDALNLSKLNATDQRYNETATIDILETKVDAINTTTNIKVLGFNTTAELDNKYVDVNGDTMSGNLNMGENNITNVNFIDGDLLVNSLNGVYLDTVQDLMDTTQSSGKISGGAFNNNSDGTVNITAGYGIIRLNSTINSPAYFFEWAESNNLVLVDETTNYIYVDYNGGIPTLGTETTKTANNRNKILLGKIFREDKVIHKVEAGMYIAEATKNILGYLTEKHGEVTRVSGYVASEVDERYISTTEGVLWAGLTRLTTSTIDTNASGILETYYRNGSGGWHEVEYKQINNTYWDDGTGTLNDLTPNRYGVHWIYGDPDGHLMVVFGQGDYTLSLAELSQPPSSLPDHVAQFGFLVAKAIVKKSAANLYSLGSAYDTAFTPGGASIHNELSGLQGGTATEYYHFTLSEHTELSNWLNSITLGSDGSIVSTADINTTGKGAFATVNTGQGDNELYPMNQPVLTSSDSTFLTVVATNFTGALIGNANAWITLTSLESKWFSDVGNVLTFDEVEFNVSLATKAEIGDCAAGSYVVNITDSGVECDTPSGSGTVTSVATDDTYLTGGPITGTGTITFNTSLAGIGLAVNSSDNWDGLDSPSDINAGDITDDGTYRLESWDNFTGIPHATPANGDITHFSLSDEIYDWVIGFGYSTEDTNASTACSGSTTYLDGDGNCDDISSVYLSDVVSDTTPQLGGNLDGNGYNVSVDEGSMFCLNVACTRYMTSNSTTTIIKG